MNMNKGFTVFETRFADKEIGFKEGLDELGMILLNEIGGSMGPIYGTILMDMAEVGEDLENIGLEDCAKMLEAGLEGQMCIRDRASWLNSFRFLLKCLRLWECPTG